jgi:hypothetical protein
VISDARDRGISGNVAKIEVDIVKAMTMCSMQADWAAENLALHIQAVPQVAFIFAKDKEQTDILMISNRTAWMGRGS